MAKIQKRSFAVTALTVCALAATATSVSALTAEVAKKCRAFAIKAHPTALAGSKSGSDEVQRAFFRDCVAKGGNVEEPKSVEKPKDGNASGK